MIMTPPPKTSGINCAACVKVPMSAVKIASRRALPRRSSVLYGVSSMSRHTSTRSRHTSSWVNIVNNHCENVRQSSWTKTQPKKPAASKGNGAACETALLTIFMTPAPLKPLPSPATTAKRKRSHDCRYRSLNILRLFSAYMLQTNSSWPLTNSQFMDGVGHNVGKLTLINQSLVSRRFMSLSQLAELRVTPVHRGIPENHSTFEARQPSNLL